LRSVRVDASGSVKTKKKWRILLFGGEGDGWGSEKEGVSVSFRFYPRSLFDLSRLRELLVLAAIELIWRCLSKDGCPKLRLRIWEGASKAIGGKGIGASSSEFQPPKVVVVVGTEDDDSRTTIDGRKDE